MEREQLFAGRRCFLLGDEGAECVLLQPVDARGSRSFAKLAEAIRASAPRKPFLLCGFPVADWNDDLSPWPAPPAFRGKGFGGQAEKTLGFLADGLLPALGTDRQICLGGYSMAGLFSLWAAMIQGGFVGVAGVSPSLWFPGWADYARERQICTEAVYLSLGTKEENTRFQDMTSSGESIRALEGQLTAQSVSHILEWNPGGHFSDPTGRTARGFAWLLNQ